jgi:hypothetical protein
MLCIVYFIRMLNTEELDCRKQQRMRDSTLRAMISGGAAFSVHDNLKQEYDEPDTSVGPGSSPLQITSQRTLRCLLDANTSLQDASSEIRTMQMHANRVQLQCIPLPQVSAHFTGLW